MIGTSIYIKRRRLEKITEAASILNISESELLSVLLMKSRRHFGDSAVTGKTVDHQKKEDTSNFVIHHINISETDYEFATGRRYIFKISVSYIFALAVDAFLSEIIYEWTHNKIETACVWKRYLTNIFTRCFHIDHFRYDSTELWIISWPES